MRYRRRFRRYGFRSRFGRRRFSRFRGRTRRMVRRPRMFVTGYRF